MLTSLLETDRQCQGVFRGFLGAGEAICFGVDSIDVPFMKEAAVIFTFYTTGVLVFAYLAAFHVTETEYFNGEDDVIIPKHILAEHHITEELADEEKQPIEQKQPVEGHDAVVGDDKA